MPKLIYVERDALDHGRTAEILGRFPRAQVVECEHYGELFNRKAQNFRLQKRHPALILALKRKNFVLRAPEGYAIGGAENYYFSHMLNCPYDCRYCFLQGMYRSASQVIFVNYEDFQQAMVSAVRQSREDCWFFSGYDCDSLAYDAVTGFSTAFLPFFRGLDRAWIELRTKSTKIAALLRMAPVNNCVVAFSFTDPLTWAEEEHGVPPVEKRVQAMRQLQERGWRVGLRFDPLIQRPGGLEAYEALFAAIFGQIDAQRLHSVSTGHLRMPQPFFENIVRLYPDARLFAGRFEVSGKSVSYPAATIARLDADIHERLLRYVPADILYPCRLQPVYE